MSSFYQHTYLVSLRITFKRSLTLLPPGEFPVRRSSISRCVFESALRRISSSAAVVLLPDDAARNKSRPFALVADCPGPPSAGQADVSPIASPWLPPPTRGQNLPQLHLLHLLHRRRRRRRRRRLHLELRSQTRKSTTMAIFMSRTKLLPKPSMRFYAPSHNI